MDIIKKTFPNWLILFLVTFILGLILITIYYSSPTPKTILVEFMGTIGKTILGSGIFLVLLKSIQFSGIFREEIRKVFDSDEFLRKRNDLPELWKNVTAAMYQSAFPSISKKIHDLVRNKLLPVRLSFYHKNLMLVYEINKVDDHHFELIETQHYQIISDGKKVEVCFDSRLIKTNDENDKSLLEVKLTINNTDLTGKISTNDVPCAEDEIGKGWQFNHVLEGEKIYEVTKVTRSIHSLQLNGYWNYEIGRVTDFFTLDIRNNGGFEIDVVPYGNTLKMKDIPASPTVSFKIHNDILTPGDGILLLVK